MEPHSRKLLLFPPENTSDFRQPPPPPPLPYSISGYSPSGLSNFPEDPPADSSTAATVVVIVAVLLLFVLFSIHIRRLGNRNRSLQRHSRLAQPLPPSPPPPPQSVDLHILKSLPVFAFKGIAKYQSDCSICLGEYEENECVKQIPFCQHVYHPDCIDTWLSSHVSCPVCRSTRFFKCKHEEKDKAGWQIEYRA